jgi:hypothetical protein
MRKQVLIFGLVGGVLITLDTNTHRRIAWLQ